MKPNDVPSLLFDGYWTAETFDEDWDWSLVTPDVTYTSLAHITKDLDLENPDSSVPDRIAKRLEAWIGFTFGLDMFEPILDIQDPRLDLTPIDDAGNPDGHPISTQWCRVPYRDIDGDRGLVIHTPTRHVFVLHLDGLRYIDLPIMAVVTK